MGILCYVIPGLRDCAGRSAIRSNRIGATSQPPTETFCSLLPRISRGDRKTSVSVRGRGTGRRIGRLGKIGRSLCELGIDED